MWGSTESRATSRRSPQLAVVAAAGGAQRVRGHPLLHVLQVAAVRAALAPRVQTPDHLSDVSRKMHRQLLSPLLGASCTFLVPNVGRECFQTLEFKAQLTLPRNGMEAIFCNEIVHSIINFMLIVQRINKIRAKKQVTRFQENCPAAAVEDTWRICGKSAKVDVDNLKA